MVQYLMWRVLKGMYNTVNLHLMITGHTKFSPDAYFSHVKRKFRKTPVSSLDDLAKVVDDSAACNVCQLVGAQNGTSLGRVPLLLLPPPGRYQAAHITFVLSIQGQSSFGTLLLQKRRKLLRVAWRPSAVNKPPSITPQGL